MTMKPRQANFEILRIVSMLAVVLCHFITMGTNQYGGTVTVGFMNGGLNSFTYPFFTAVSSIGVPCFVLITGYFISGSRRLRLDRILKVWGPTVFYSVVLASLSFFLGGANPADVLKSFAPVGTGQYWFVTKYIAIIMLAPVLSIIVDAVSKKGLQIVLAILAFLTVTVTCGIPYGNQFFTENPLSVAVFVLYFMIAAYIRKYDVSPWVARYSGLIFLAGILLQGLGGIGMNMVRKPVDFIYGGFSINYNAFSIIPSTVLFIWFKNHEFKDNLFTKLACRFAPYVFAAYLIHNNRHFQFILWGRIFNPADYWQSPMWTLYALAVPIMIVIVSGIVDMVRKKVFSICGFDALVSKVGKFNIDIE